MFIVAPHFQIMEQLGSKDSSRNLVAICANSYFFKLYLILHVIIQTFDVTGCIMLSDVLLEISEYVFFKGGNRPQVEVIWYENFMQTPSIPKKQI